MREKRKKKERIEKKRKKEYELMEKAKNERMNC